MEGRCEGGGPYGYVSDSTTDGERMARKSASRKGSVVMAGLDEAEKVLVKRPKQGSPKTRPKVAAAPVVPIESESEAIFGPPRAPVKAPKKEKKLKGAVSDCGWPSSGEVTGANKAVNVSHPEYVDECRRIKSNMLDVMLAEQLPASAVIKMMTVSAEFEALLLRVMVENATLKGRLGAMEDCLTKKVMADGAAPVVPVRTEVVAPPAPLAVPAAAPVLNVPKPVETWAVVVKGKGGTTSKEVVKKVVEKVAPTLGVRVHEVRPTRDGGAVIRTPSRNERQKIAENTVFAKVGLEVSVKDKLGMKIVVQRVASEVSPEEFMEDLFSMNLKEMMSLDAFRKSVRLLSKPWNTGGGQQVNVYLECSSQVGEHLRATGAYIKWFRFLVRTLDAVPACYRCLGLDHRVGECRLQKDVCRRCGTPGHLSRECPNEVRCRDCAFKGMAAKHLMHTRDCPMYVTLMARESARH